MPPAPSQKKVPEEEEAGRPPELDLSPEQKRVRRWRINQARSAGLSMAESELFADSDASLGLLRELVQKGATISQIVRIVL